MVRLFLMFVRYIGVVQFETGYLAPDAGAVTFIEIEQFFQVGIAAFFDIAFNEAAGQVRSSVVVQVHG